MGELFLPPRLWSCTINKLHVSLLQVGAVLGGGGGCSLLVCSNPECLGHQREWLPREPFPFV